MIGALEFKIFVTTLLAVIIKCIRLKYTVRNMVEGRGINLEGIIVLDDREKYREGKF